MFKRDSGSEEKVYGMNNENIKKIESNDSISSSISSISLYSCDSRNNSIEYKINSNENICGEEYKKLISYENNFILENDDNFPIRKARRQRETQNVLAKSPQLSDALKIIEKSKSYYIPIDKSRSLSISSCDYFVGDFNESKCE